MSWNVEHTDEFAHWWRDLGEAQQEDVTRDRTAVDGTRTQAAVPYSSGIAGSKYAHMRELRVQSGGRPIRVFYAFDPRRLGDSAHRGDKTGDDRSINA